MADWWAKNPSMNVGLVAGGNLGLVLDLDPPRKGKPSGLLEWDRLRSVHGTVPETRTVQTGSGGRHLFFREPAGRRNGVTTCGMREAAYGSQTGSCANTGARSTSAADGRDVRRGPCSLFFCLISAKRFAWPNP